MSTADIAMILGNMITNALPSAVGNEDSSDVNSKEPSPHHF